MTTLTLFRCHSGSRLVLCLNNSTLPSALSALTLMWCCATEQVWPERMLGSDWGAHSGSHRKMAKVLGYFHLLPLPCFGSKQVLAHPSQEESRFLTALLLVSLVFKPAKQTHLPGLDPRAVVPNMGLKPLIPQGGFPSSSVFPDECTGPDLSTYYVWIFSYILDCARIFLPSPLCFQ